MTNQHHASTCPYFIGNYMKSCVALQSVYVPSGTERSSFCTVPWHTLCTNYQQRQYSGAKEQTWQSPRN